MHNDGWWELEVFMCPGDDRPIGPGGEETEPEEGGVTCRKKRSLRRCRDGQLL